MLGSALFLAGCSTKNTLGIRHEFQGTTEEAEQQETDDPELQLVTTEEESTLEQELKALHQTGQWGDRGTIFSVGNDPSQPSPYDFPVVLNKQVAMYLELFQNGQHDQLERWLSRSGRYMPLMEKKLKKAGLPTDLVYLSMIESGYNQRAYSRAHAVGLWQFMKETGKEYNLNSDQYVDERRDAEKSTTAAANFLSDLYREFGDWHLAVAAYNAGPGKIKNGLAKYNVDNFWDLAKYDYLALETKRYVPKLIAAIIIARQPEKFGFSDIQYEKSIAYDTLAVGPGMSLEAVSMIAGTNTATIKELNQELRLGKTPANTSQYQVKIPAGSRQLASRNMDRLHSYVSTDYQSHTIRRGETVASICRKYDINTTTLLKVNNLRSARLKPGKNLRIPFSTVKYQLIPEGNKAMLASFKENLVLHRIKKGETVSTISKKYCVPTELIVNWNGLKSVKSIRTGQQLALYIDGAGKKLDNADEKGQSSISVIAASTTKLLKTGNATPAKVAANTAQDKPPTIKPRKKSLPAADPDPVEEYSWYKVQNGDSLWDISRKFKISTDQLRDLNNLTSDRLQPGSRLKMKKA